MRDILGSLIKDDPTPEDVYVNTMRYTEWAEKYGKEMVCEPVLLPHVEVPMSPAQYEELKITRPNAFCRTLYCEHRGTAYMLDPENEDDMRLLRELERKSRKAHGF